MTAAVDKKHCDGCRNDHYNRPPNDGCWSLDSAKIGSFKLVPAHQRPPWNMESRRLPNCYQRDGFVRVGKNVTQ